MPIPLTPREYRLRHQKRLLIASLALVLLSATVAWARDGSNAAASEQPTERLAGAPSNAAAKMRFGSLPWGPAETLPTATHEEALNLAAEFYARRWDVSQAEALRRLNLQLAVGPVAAQ